MARARRSQLPASRGSTETICARVCMPARKSRLAKAASASLRSVATGLAICPDSVLIWVSSRTALSARSDRWNGLSAAKAVKEKRSDERGGKAGADRREHRETSLDPEPGPCIPSTWRADLSSDRVGLMTEMFMMQETRLSCAHLAPRGRCHPPRACGARSASAASREGVTAAARRKLAPTPALPRKRGRERTARVAPP